ncbi:MAG TPA: FlgO family outer membrane protein [Usitatibacter sp.]|nr:FlgO family outer membrane protein [Usitatibacter sp.]
MPGPRFAFGPFVFDAGRAILLRHDKPVAVGHRGLAVLHALLRAGGNVVTKEELIDAAWPGAVVEESNLSVQVAALRKLLGAAPDGIDWIATIPRIGYRFAGDIAVEEPPVRPSPAVEPADPERKPSIAVLPFVNLSVDPQQVYFADGMTEEIIAALSRFRWFFVRARSASFAFRNSAMDVREIARRLEVAYVLEGSVRKSARQVRISARLVEAASARQVWVDHYDVEPEDAFAVQDRIAERVAGAIEPELLRMESALAARRRRTGNVNAWDLVYHGTWFFHRVTRETHLRARELFRRARGVDPGLPEAASWLARVSAGLIAYGWTDDEGGDAREGTEAALQAVQMDEKNPYAHYGLAIVSVYDGVFDQAARAAEKALELSPSFALGHLVLGMARLFSGDAAGAVRPLERGLRLNPYDPQNFVWYDCLALAHLFAGQPSDAREDALNALKVRPSWRPTLEIVACCQAKLGDVGSARASVEQLSRLESGPSDPFSPLRRGNPEWAKELRTLLARAGMHEPIGSGG